MRKFLVIIALLSVLGCGAGKLQTTANHNVSRAGPFGIIVNNGLPYYITARIKQDQTQLPDLVLPPFGQQRLTIQYVPSTLEFSGLINPNGPPLPTQVFTAGVNYPPNSPGVIFTYN